MQTQSDRLISLLREAVGDKAKDLQVSGPEKAIYSGGRSDLSTDVDDVDRTEREKITVTFAFAHDAKKDWKSLVAELDTVQTVTASALKHAKDVFGKNIVVSVLPQWSLRPATGKVTGFHGALSTNRGIAERGFVVPEADDI